MKYLVLFLALVSTTFAINYHGCTLASDNLHGWVVAIDTVLILRTTDGGLTWTPQSAPPDTVSRRLWDITCFNDQLAWTTGKHNLHAAEILATTDGGNQWLRQIAGFSKYGTRIEFYDQNYGIAVGGDGALAMTTNGGNYWEQIFTDWFEAEYYGVSIINTSDSWICAGWPDSVITGQGYIVPTSDGGFTWDTMVGYHASGYEDFYDIHFFNLSEGIVVGGDESNFDPIILRTTDFGVTWNPVSAPANTYYLRAVDFVGDEGWAVGKSGSMIHTTDRGNTWTTQSSPADSTLFDVDFSDNQHGLACGYGYILRTTDGGQNWQPTGIEELKTNVPGVITLTATPNPFRQITDITYQIPDDARQNAGLKIFDVTGRQVRDFSGQSSVISHQLSVRWDGTDDQGNNLAAGVYFVELNTTQHSLSTKIILLE
jgi:photosystem II stability/assembly factor-like uncharacterized protein